VALYVVCTAAIQQLLLHAVGPVSDWSDVASQPGGMLLDRLGGVRSPGQLLGLLPGPYYVGGLVRSYPPLPPPARLGGPARLGRDRTGDLRRLDHLLLGPLGGDEQLLPDLRRRRDGLRRARDPGGAGRRWPARGGREGTGRADGLGVGVPAGRRSGPG